MLDSKLTPMMRQYQQMKNEIPSDAVLLMRLGDFYEVFFDDATIVSKVLDITLTKRHGDPMCGVPYHALDNYLPRLLKSGIKVAIAEQIEDPKEAKGIVKREVSRIITPGTVVDSGVLSPDRNNFLVAIVSNKKDEYGLACLDISTGDFRVIELNGKSELETELHRLNAKECLLPQKLLDEWESEQAFPYIVDTLLWTPLEDWIFSIENARDLLKRHFAVGSLDGFGCRNMTLSVMAAGAIMHYTSENLRCSVDHIKNMKTYHSNDYMVLDTISQRNLELVEPMFGGSKENTLLHILDKTATPMGSRLLREWLLRPLFQKEAILERLDAVDLFRNDPLTLAEMREIIGAIRDLERVVARLNIGSANARDMLALASSLKIIPDLKILLENFDIPLLNRLNSRLHKLPKLVDRIDMAVEEDPPLTLHDGGIICEGYNGTLDELRQAASEGKSWLAGLQAEEVKRTGIKSLKIKYNKVFGYYIEVSKSNLTSVPENYIRKQTLVNAERFITPELKEIENKILGAEDKSKALEYELFQELRSFSLAFTIEIQETANALASVDVLLSLAECARKYNYCRPKIRDDEKLRITAGRHPVLDATMQDERFVPNDVLLDGSANRMMIITGPNMAGKSTYIRQTALLVLMAQMGSFISADSAEVGLVDRIFTRVGAADDISRGQSTFMVEMVETANILNHVTPKSLVILDEIGRGTSTFDGLSIAWAVAEYLHDSPKARARTQFATHYHELTELSITRKGVKNYNVAVREYGDKIIFLRQIIPGGTDQSYGIHVAKLAGLPSKVIERANEVLENLENQAFTKGGLPVLAEHHYNVMEDSEEYGAEDDAPDAFQPSLFG